MPWSEKIARIALTRYPGKTQLELRSVSAPARSIRPRAVDHFFERDVFFAFGAADQTHLLEIVLGLEQVALFGMPHAVIGPGQCVFRIGGERFVIPMFGIVVAPELAAPIARQGGALRIVVIASAPHPRG